MLNLGSRDPSLRLAAYNLLCAVTKAFNLKVEERLLEGTGTEIQDDSDDDDHHPGADPGFILGGGVMYEKKGHPEKVKIAEPKKKKKRSRSVLRPYTSMYCIFS